MVTAANTKMTKTAFVTALLQKNPKTTVKTAKAAWAEAGYPGTLSGTLVSKLRSDLGFAGNIRAARKSKVVTNGAVKRPVGRPKGSFKTRVQAPVHSNGEAAPMIMVVTSKVTNRAKTLDGIEAGIDDLIFSLKSIGNFADVEAALRSARRLLARSHGE